MKYLSLLLLILLLDYNAFSQLNSNYEIVLTKDNKFDEQFAISSHNHKGFWLIGEKYIKENNYHLNLDKITTLSPVKGFITKINDSLYMSSGMTRDSTYITHDYGKTWEFYFKKPFKNEAYFYVLDEQTIFFIDRKSNILKSIDGGITWAKILEESIGITDVTANIYFRDKSNGIVYRKFRYSPDNRDSEIKHEILVTNDGGNTWTTTPDKTVYNAFRISSEGSTYYILTLGNQIYKSITNGILWEQVKNLDTTKAVFKDFDKGIRIDNTSFKPFVLYSLY